MQELVERVLSVGAGLAPHDRAAVAHDRRAVEADRLAVGLHVELLQVRREPRQLLGVRQDRLGGRAEHVGVPDAEHGHDDRGVLGEGRRSEVLVDTMESVEELTEALRADRDHQRQADGRGDRVTPAHPVPEPEHVGDVDAELGDPFGIRRHRHEVIGDG